MPSQFFYGVVVANQSDADFQQADLKRQLEPNQRPTTRFHDDLLNVTIELLNRFFPDHKRDIYALLLRSQSTADIYEQTLRSDVDTTPRDCQTGHSGLFTFCANVSNGAQVVTAGKQANEADSVGTPQCVHHLQPKDDNAAYDPTSSKCRSCGRYYIVHALPDAVRRLFLRIVEPETREDGSKIIVTAKEAYDVMKEVMAA